MSIAIFYGDGAESIWVMYTVLIKHGGCLV